MNGRPTLSTAIQQAGQHFPHSSSVWRWETVRFGFVFAFVSDICLPCEFYRFSPPYQREKAELGWKPKSSWSECNLSSLGLPGFFQIACAVINLEGDLVFIIFWPPHCGHALDVEPDKVVEGGAADPVDPEENHLVAQLVPGLTLLPRVGDDGHHQESCPKHDVQDGEREDPLVEPLTPHVVSWEDDSQEKEEVGDDDEGGEDRPRDHSIVALGSLVVLPAGKVGTIAFASSVVLNNFLSGHLSVVTCLRVFSALFYCAHMCVQVSLSHQLTHVWWHLSTSSLHEAPRANSANVTAVHFGELPVHLFVLLV